MSQSVFFPSYRWPPGRHFRCREDRMPAGRPAVRKGRNTGVKVAKTCAKPASESPKPARESPFFRVFGPISGCPRLGLRKLVMNINRIISSKPAPSVFRRSKQGLLRSRAASFPARRQAAPSRNAARSSSSPSNADTNRNSRPRAPLTRKNGRPKGPGLARSGHFPVGSFGVPRWRNW